MTTRLLVLVPDGAAAVRAVTAAADALPYRGRLTTVPEGLSVASEVALPGLLGHPPTVAPARGPVEAAAVGAMPRPGEAAWRLDVGDVAAGVRDPGRLAAVLAAAVGGDVRHLRRGRFLLIGPERWLTDGREGARADAAHHRIGIRPRIWGGGGPIAWPTSPASTAVVCASSGAAAGVARLLGADVVAPAGATGFADTDLVAKATCAADLLVRGEHDLVMVHVGAPDEAGHARDAQGQRRCLEAFDRAIVAPLARQADALGIAVLVAADHGTDPRTGAHLGGPVAARASFPLADGAFAWDVVRRITQRQVAA